MRHQFMKGEYFSVNFDELLVRKLWDTLIEIRIAPVVYWWAYHGPRAVFYSVTWNLKNKKEKYGPMVKLDSFVKKKWLIHIVWHKIGLGPLISAYLVLYRSIKWIPLLRLNSWCDFNSNLSPGQWTVIKIFQGLLTNYVPRSNADKRIMKRGTPKKEERSLWQGHFKR